MLPPYIVAGESVLNRQTGSRSHFIDHSRT